MGHEHRYLSMSPFSHHYRPKVSSPKKKAIQGLSIMLGPMAQSVDDAGPDKNSCNIIGETLSGACCATGMLITTLP